MFVNSFRGIFCVLYFSACATPMTTDINLIGVYKVIGQPNVHLVELYINAKHTDFDVGDFTQQQEGVDRLNWQAPWDEKYLNNEGTEIISSSFNLPKELTDTTRLVFFLHFVNFDKPLMTSFGCVDLMQPEPMPTRLSSIIKYEQPD